MKFIDEVTLEVKAGDGGPGCVSFYRGAGIPLGGPDGGDGGNGGSIFFKADESVSTLLDLRFTRRIVAKNGAQGMGKDMNGRGGEPITVRVPVGTLIWDADSSALIADLSEAGQAVKVAQGGMGGLGNMNFATSTRRAPRFAQPGTPGEERRLRVELRLLADVGLVGFPNVGKSTLISRISAAKPKIADYPFTTLVPNLGVVRVDLGASFVVADIPGLIPGASEGAGLGFQFLRHISRVRVILHMLAFDFGEGRSPVGDYAAIRRELELYQKELGDKPEIIVLNKIELPECRAQWPAVQALAKKHGRACFAISGVTGEGVRELVNALSKAVLGRSVEDTREALPERLVRGQEARGANPVKSDKAAPAARPKKAPKKATAKSKKAPRQPARTAPKRGAKKAAKSAAKPKPRARAAAKKKAR